MLPRPSTSPKSPNNPSNQVPSCNGILATFWSHLPLPLRAILITIFITIVIQILIANFSAFLDQKFETFEMKFQNDISQIQNSNSKLEAKSSSFLDKIFGTFEKKFQNDTSEIQNSISKLDEKLKNISQSQMENGKFAILLTIYRGSSLSATSFSAVLTLVRFFEIPYSIKKFFI